MEQNQVSNQFKFFSEELFQYTVGLLAEFTAAHAFNALKGLVSVKPDLAAQDPAHKYKIPLNVIRDIREVLERPMRAQKLLQHIDGIGWAVDIPTSPPVLESDPPVLKETG